MVNYRDNLEKLYTDRCDVIEVGEVTDKITHITTHEEVVVYQDVKCRISSKTLTSTSDDKVGEISQTIKLFIAPDITINAGSRIVVTRGGVAKSYKRSGEPFVFADHKGVPTHQEIILEALEDYV